MKSKAERQFAIREIIGTAPVRSQDELRRRLKQKGLNFTQATLSRDLREIGVNWTNDRQGGHYALPAPDEAPVPRPTLPTQVVGIAHNECLLIVHTLPGSASIVGELVDRQRSPLVLGTVAGDNTLLVVPATTASIPAVREFLTSLLIKGAYE